MKIQEMMRSTKFGIAIICFMAAFLTFSAHELNAQNLTTVKVEVFPNPVTSNEFTISAELEITEVVILNVLGQPIYTQQFIGENSIKILLDARESGLYLLQVKTIDGRVTTKRVLFK